MRSGRIRGDQDPEIVATQLWSCVHGFTVLELSGHFTQFRDPVRYALRSMTTNVLIGLGDTAELALRVPRFRTRGLERCGGLTFDF
ncbi:MULTISPECIES: TetR-like C-terminal domain-containing protein [Rhodococcus]|uniref:HTH-type transcriptional regulator MT1864/Rv1816-like C-terminal domain-containing protein n=1 Tax=Rhodococcus wratislaviensis NBRC 100605 TaxID=1219028 RepID=X0PKZ8_RHOWR|nr:MULTISPECIES: TetR-like C-terminal domain-containing protein [Rhodococcus]GAF43104.1 hypothetical protein RW1_005_02130 [Rhodococcus wratislaviensis NBRC 100605]